MAGFEAWFLNKSGEILEGIGAQTNPKIQEYIQGIDNLEGLDISFIQVGHGFAPEPITPESYIAQVPYSNPVSIKQQMDASVKRGWLKVSGDGEFGLTENAADVAARFLKFGNKLFGSLVGLSETENLRTADLLAELVENAERQPIPTEKPTLEIGRLLEPDLSEAAMVRIRRYLTDMAYFRDDVHMSSWQSYEVGGISWETLTYFWRGEASSATEISDQVSEYRRYTEKDYADAIDDLVARGWLIQKTDKFVITEEGKKVRQEAEDLTDHLYGEPFKVFSEGEIKELTGLLETLAETFPAPEKDADDQ